MSKPENPSAFPHTSHHTDDQRTHGGSPYKFTHHGQSGMTLRDWFAGQALIGLMSNDEHDHCPLFGDGKPFARDAYIVADAMLVARQKSEPDEPVDPIVEAYLDQWPSAKKLPREHVEQEIQRFKDALAGRGLKIVGVGA